MGEWSAQRVRSKARAAVKVDTPVGEKTQTSYGVIWITAQTFIDRENELVELSDIQITKANFPTAPEKTEEYLGIMFSGGRAPVLLNGVVGAMVTQPDPSLSYNELTYRLALRQELTPDISFYASYNHGFKAGQFSLQAPVDPPVKPQYIDAYELGIKSELFDRRLRFNAAVYRYDIDDFQSRSGGNLGSSILLNAAKVKVTVPAGTFDAVVLIKSTATGSKTYWYVPGVGKVKETGGQTEELVSFDVDP